MFHHFYIHYNSEFIIQVKKNLKFPILAIGYIRKTSFTHYIILRLQFSNWKFTVLKFCLSNYSVCQQFPNKIIISENVSRASNIEFFLACLESSPMAQQILLWQHLLYFQFSRPYCLLAFSQCPHSYKICIPCFLSLQMVQFLKHHEIINILLHKNHRLL